MKVMSLAHEVVAEDPTKLAEANDDDEEDAEVSPEKLVY